MTHWKTAYLGKYAGMDLIDRKQLLKDLGYDNEENIKKDFDEGYISEETTDMLSFINGAEKIDPVAIVEQYEQSVEKEKETNP